MITLAIDGMISPFIPTELWFYCQFLLGYLLILVIPGPNMMVVGTFAACRGLRGVMVLIASIGLGAASLSLFMSLIVHIALPTDGLRHAITLANITLLSFTAWLVLRMKEPSSAHIKRPVRTAGNDFVIGFMCGFLNPITAAYFLSQYLFHAQNLPISGPPILLNIAVMVLAMSNLTLIASLLSKPVAQAWARKHFRIITRLVSGTIAAIALRTAISLLLFVPATP